MSVTASAVIASTFIAAETADAASHKVRSGDTLWSISQKYGTSVGQLKSWNNLNNEIIFPNQVLEVGGNSAPPKSNSSSKNNSSTSKTASTYTVKSGDSLSRIAAAHGISLKNLMDWNNLKTTLIYPGDKLAVSKGATPSNGSSTSKPPTNSNSGSSGGSTYTVKSGDTLSGIAASYGVSVKNLKDWNKLNSDLIYPGNKLVVNKSGAPSQDSKPNQGGGNNSTPNNSSSTYTVKSGDTLSKIASVHGVSLSNLMAWNNLSSHLIYVGDKLVINGSAAPPKNNNGSSSGSPVAGDLIATAKSVMGAPYVWAGNTPSGFDCSGFIYWAFNNSGTSNIGRLSTEGYYNRSYIVNTPQVGDLVFFEGTYKSGISHMGIYVGNNSFIHAGSSTGVTITSLSNSYWSKHFHSYKRFY